MNPKSVGRIMKDKAIFFQCDIQQVFKDKIYKCDSVITVAKMMNQIAPIFSIPLLVTEHNAKTFGGTVQDIVDTYPPKFTKFDKLLFSMVTDEVKGFLKENSERKTIVLYGIETHVCIQQTTLDLLELGYDVHLLADGVSSIRPGDRTGALKRMEQSGAYITTAESAIFELLKHAKVDEFKPCLKVLKTDRSDQITHL